MSNEVTLEFSSGPTLSIVETTVTLESVGGSSASDVAALIATHNADTTAVHGIADTAALDTVAARNAAIAAIYGAAGVWTDGQSFRAETVYQKAALATGNFTPFSIDPQDTGARDWNFNIGTALFDGTRPDVIFNWGYNNATSGGADDATDAAWYLQLESYYEHGALQEVEYHLNYYNGATSFRPFQYNVDRVTHNARAWYYGNEWSWANPANTITPMSIVIGATAAASSVLTQVPTVIRYDAVGLVLQTSDLAKQFQFDAANQTLSFSESTAAIKRSSAGGYLQLTNFNRIDLGTPTAFIASSTLGNISYYDLDIVSTNGFLYSKSVKVVGQRVIDARCDDAINSGDATTDGVIDSLRDAMIAHGLIAAA